ncbi:hypothetical protein N7493_007791 [Penicillium malachiteum]|uniref:Uncharacterized protein n=1 Tax=Penicillium malachiteum TaxID=1324776 RepID=A0AAD6MUG6_9EURO|nr:hypothetical protein N7493_007791 [Penicillium malachiteum]
MLFCQSLLYIVTFQAAMAIALPQGELGIEDKCKHAMDIAKAADPAILEGIEAIEAQPLMDKASSEKIYQGVSIKSSE